MNDNQILNKILKGELMAIEIMKTYENALTNTELKHSINKWINDHINNASKIANYIKGTHSVPENSIGLSGMIANTTARINTIFHSEPSDILHEIYDGEDKGIERSVQLSKNQVSKDATQLLEGVFKIDHNHLKEMKELITKYEQL